MGSPRGMPGNDENNYYPRSYSASARLRNDLAVVVARSRFYVYVYTMAIPSSILSIVDINWTRGIIAIRGHRIGKTRIHLFRR